ncbi:MAG: hypothetical protein ACI37S_03625 [Candidatus Gastranaerophilaceae bacterium]
MKRLFTLLVIISMTVLSAVAADEKTNILNSIQIDSLNDTYSIVLNSDKALDVKRTNQSPDNMILTLKNIKPSKSLNTIYKNAAEVDSIMVEPVGENNLNVIIKAKNISNSAVSTEASETELQASNGKSVLTPKKAKKSKKDYITLAAPVSDYMPVYNDDVEDIDDMSSFIPTFGFVEKIKSILSMGNISNIVTTGLVALIVLCVAKLFKKEEKEPVVGLAQSLKEREMSLYKDLSQNHTSFTQAPRKSMSFDSNVNRALLNSNIKANAGYGMKAYQSSNRNPYMSSDVIHNNKLNTNLINNSMLPKNSMTSGIKKSQAQPKVMSTVGSRVNINNSASNTIQMNSNNNVATPANIDSIKFLESMTKIYEKNGRADLAQGLKSGMLKAKK